MGLTRILTIVRSRAKLFCTLAGGVVALVAAASLLAPREYVAELQLVVDPRGADPLADKDLAPQLAPAHLATQAEIIRSRNAALKVIDDLRLHEDPQIVERFGAAGGRDMRAWLVNSMLKSVDARSSRNSNIIRVSYTSDDPDTAARMANAFADAYIKASLELKVDPARRQAAWFGDQVEQLRQELVTAQDRLAQYQREHGVLGVDEARIDVENARLQEISNQLVKAQAAMYEAQTRRGSERSSATLPDLISNPLLQNLKAELARAEAKFAELSQRYDVNHPHYRAAAAEVEALRSRLASESGATRGSLDEAAGIARRNVDEVQAALNEQKERIIALNQQRDEMTVLRRDVESARTAYDAALRKANETRLESRVDRTNVAVLNPATPPLWPSSPRIALNIVVGLLAGLALATGVILMLEMFDRRIRSAQDLLEYAGLDVLAEVPVAAGSRRRSWSRRALPLKPQAQDL